MKESNNTESSRVPFPQADDVNPQVPSSTEITNTYVCHLIGVFIPECIDEFHDNIDHIRLKNYEWEVQEFHKPIPHSNGEFSLMVPCPRCLHSLSPPIKTAEALGILDDPEEPSNWHKAMLQAAQAIGRSTHTSAPANYIVVSPAVASGLEPLFQDKYVRHIKKKP